MLSEGGSSAPTFYGRCHGSGADRGGLNLPSRLSTPIGKFRSEERRGDMSLEAAASGFSRDDMIIAVRMNTEGGDPEILAILHPAFDRVIEFAFFNNRFGLSDAAQRECQVVEQLLLELLENEPE